MAVIELASGTVVPNNTNPIWYKDAGIRKNVLLCCICFVAQITAGFDEVTTGSFQAMQSWQTDMSYPDPARIGLISSMLFAGGIVGSMIGAPIADRFGRRVVLATGASCCFIGSILQSASVNVGMFIFGRAVIGMGVTQTLIGGPSLVAEIAHPRIRGTILSFYNVLWYVGSILASWLTFGTGHLASSWAWRIPSICQFIPSLFILCMIWLVPESPRFLMSKGRREEAWNILAKYHANGDRNDELVLFEMQELDNDIEWATSSKKQSWVVLVQGTANRKRMFIVLWVAISVSWCGQGIITYYFSPILTSIGVKSTNQQTGINGGMQIWNLVVAVVGACLVDRIGRRPLWLISFSGMVLANIPLIITSAVYARNGNLGAAYVSIVTLFLYNAAFNIGCNPLPYSYTTEILPYNIRAKGLAFFNILCWSLGLASQYANPVALSKLGWKWYCFYLGLCVIFVIVIYFIYPETKGCSLEEIAVLFDKKDKDYVIEAVDVEQDHDEKSGSAIVTSTKKGNDEA